MLIYIKKQNLYNLIFCIALIFACSFFISGYRELAFVSATPVTGMVVVIDPGHGSPDGGALGVSGMLEKDFNLSIAKRIGNLLQQSGAYVVYTREDDNSIADNLNEKIRSVKINDMKKRKQIRDESGADLFLSIHMNSGDNSAYSGAQVFYQSNSDESKKLAECIQTSLKNIADKTNTRDAKDSKNSIFILKDSKIPSVLVECGFISNPDEESRLKSDVYQDKIAYSVYGGILEYIK